MGCLDCFGGSGAIREERREQERLASDEAPSEARSKAAEAAQRRQEDFENSAAGRAAKAQIQGMQKRAAAQSKQGGPVLKWQMG